MNVYDAAHSLAGAVKNSNEYKEFMRLREETQKDEMVAQMIADLEQLQVSIQTARMAGQEINEADMQHFQSVYAMVMTKPLAVQYMEAEIRLSVMMNDVFNILGDVMNIARQ